jgi:hypothetical protein
MMVHRALPACRAAAAVFLAFAGGCYRYAPMPGTDVGTTSDVRLMLTSDGSAALAPVLGRMTVGVEGRVTRVADSSLVLAVSSTLKRGDEDETSLSRTVWAGDIVQIPRRAIATMEQRSLDGRRTTIAAGMTAAIGVLAARFLVHGLGSAGSESGSGPGVPTP